MAFSPATPRHCVIAVSSVVTKGGLKMGRTCTCVKLLVHSPDEGRAGGGAGR